jgi:hypothetical protein
VVCHREQPDDPIAARDAERPLGRREPLEQGRVREQDSLRRAGRPRAEADERGPERRECALGEVGRRRRPVRDASGEAVHFDAADQRAPWGGERLGGHEAFERDAAGEVDALWRCELGRNRHEAGARPQKGEREDHVCAAVRAAKADPRDPLAVRGDTRLL